MTDHHSNVGKTDGQAGAGEQRAQRVHLSSSVRAKLSSPQTQEAFLQHIADRLGRERVRDKPKHPFRGVPDFWREYSLSMEDRISTFMENWTSLGGHAFRLQSMEEVGGFIREFVEETGAESILLQNQQALTELKLEHSVPAVKVVVWGEGNDSDELLQDAAQADVGIAVVDYAAAYTGTVAVFSSPDKGRSTSLLPKVFIAVIPADVIAANLGSILIELDDRSPSDIPAGIHFITGPSRSSDIENDLTIGVHGPGIVYALVVG